MKKVFLAVAVVTVALVACNDGEKKVEEVKSGDTTKVVTQDTTVVVKDTTIKTTTTIDTLKK